jgi:hypothetical protein
LRATRLDVLNLSASPKMDGFSDFSTGIRTLTIVPAITFRSFDLKCKKIKQQPRVLNGEDLQSTWVCATVFVCPPQTIKFDVQKLTFAGRKYNLPGANPNKNN